MDQFGKASVLNSEFNTFVQMYKTTLDRLSPGGEKIASLRDSNFIFFHFQIVRWPTNGLRS